MSSFFPGSRFAHIMTRMLCLLALACALVALSPLTGGSQAYAAEISSDFSCQDNGKAVGSLFIKRTCNVTETSLFSGIVCTYQQTLSDIFSNVYCGMKKAILRPLTLAIVLGLILFAIAFLTGMVRLTSGEVFKLVFKIALVWGFATQADLAINVGYRFLMNTASEGITIVLRTSMPSSVENTDWNADAALRHMDELSVEAVTPFSFKPDPNAPGVADNTCQSFILGLVAMFALVVPPLFLTFSYVLLQAFLMYARAMLGYLMAITGITFLMTLSPLFLGFALFTPTRKFFDNWLKYLISFTLQMIIVFAFLALIEMMDIGHLLTTTLALVKPLKDDQVQMGAVRGALGLILPSCGICEYKMEMDHKRHIEVPHCIEGGAVISPIDLVSKPDLLYGLALKFISLGILAYVTESMLKYVPELAKHLAGTPYSPRLGGTIGMNDFAAGQMATGIKSPGRETLGKLGENFEAAFRGTSGTTASRITAGLIGSTKGVSNTALNELRTEALGTGRAFMTDAPIGNRAMTKITDTTN